MQFYMTNNTIYSRLPNSLDKSGSHLPTA